MQRIYDAEAKRTYEYDMPLHDWIFSPDRMKLLTEVSK